MQRDPCGRVAASEHGLMRQAISPSPPNSGTARELRLREYLGKQLLAMSTRILCPVSLPKTQSLRLAAENRWCSPGIGRDWMTPNLLLDRWIGVFLLKARCLVAG